MAGGTALVFLSIPAHAQDSVAGVILKSDSVPTVTSRSDTGITVFARSLPTRLTEGTVGWLQVIPSRPVAIIGGQAGGEPMHFEPAGDTGFRALVAAPVGVVDSLTVSIFVREPTRIDTVVTSIPVRRAGFVREVLAVAPAYARPDSAAAARIQAEIARARQVGRTSQERPRIWRGPFRLPRPGRVTSRFGTERVYNGEVKSQHLGTDFAGRVGAPVRAAGRGVVALVADFYLAGHTVYIDHGGGLVTGYFHLSRSSVIEGDTVAPGQLIGRVGRSGRVTGPHLHWVARYGAVSVDPMSLLELVNSKR